MSKTDRYELRHTSYLEEHGKLWGWLVTTSPSNLRWGHGTFHKHCFCWWAHVGKTITVRRQQYNTGIISHLERKKAKNGYQQISTDDLLRLWPDFMEKLEDRMIFEMLSHGE